MKKTTYSVILLACLNLFSFSANAKEALLQTTSNPSITQGYVNTDEGQIHYWEAGTGPALLLIHQSSSSGEEFAGMVPYMASQYRLITFDWPGHGSSDDPMKEMGVDDFTRSALAVVDHLNIQDFHLLGNHGGALIAMNIAWKYPARVKKVILSGTSGVRKKEDVEKFTESLDLEKRNHLEKDGTSISDAWGRYVDYMPNSAPEEVLVPFLNNMITRVRPYDAHYGVLKWNRMPALKAIKDRPMLIMQGEDDEYVSHQESLLDILPNSKRVVVKDAGVFMFFEAPEASSNAVSRFLAAP